MKLSTKVLIGFLILWFAFYCSPADVNAEETIQQYTYTFAFSYYDTRDTASIDPAQYDYVWTINSPYELHMYIREESSGYKHLYWFVPDYEFKKYTENYMYIPFSYSGYINDTYYEGDSQLELNFSKLLQVFSFAINPNSTSAMQNVEYSFTGKIFDSYESVLSYCQNGDLSGLLNGTIENGGIKAVYDENIEMPEIVVDDAFEYVEFSNACEEFNIEMQGRWWTIDDMEMYKQNNYWYLKYHSTICNELTTWVEISEKINSIGRHAIFEYGDSSFNDLLVKYPVDERSFTGGTNAVGNFLSGYATAKEQYKDLLQYRIKDTALYIQPEIYVRYWYMDDNNVIHYGRWCHAYKDLYKSGYSTSPKEPTDANGYIKISDKGLTDVEKDTLENTGDSTSDLDFNRYQPEDVYKDKYEANMDWFSNYIEGFADSIGQVPDLFAKVFSFLPKELVWAIGAAIGAVIILRFLGR